MSETVARDDSAVSAGRRGAAGFIVLDRPKALNALTLPMARAIAAALDDFERDARVTRVVVMSAGGRAFCSGGDIRLFYELGRAGDHAAQLAFWREEYRLNRRIKRFPKPFVALIDGIVMGGGVGLSVHASHRVASERCLFAMPEVGIGFFPDVGAAYVLARLESRIGAFLAATGLSAEAGDVVALGLAQTFAPSAAFPDLTAALAEAGATETILARFAAPPPPGKLVAEAPVIRRWFARLERPAILAALSAAARGARRSPRRRWRRCARSLRPARRSRCGRLRWAARCRLRRRCASISASSRASAAAMTSTKACAR